MKRIYLIILLTIVVILPSVAAKSYEMEVRDLVQVNETEFTFDVRMRNTNPAEPFAIEAIQWQLSFNTAMMNGGSLDNAYLTYVSGTTDLVGTDIIPQSANFSTDQVVIQWVTASLGNGAQTTLFNDGNWKRIGTFRLQLRNLGNTAFQNFAEVAHGLAFVPGQVIVNWCNYTGTGPYYRDGAFFEIITNQTLTNSLTTTRQLAGYCFTGTGTWNTAARWNNITTANFNTIPGSANNAIIAGSATATDARTVNQLTVASGGYLVLNQAAQLTTTNLYNDNISGGSGVVTVANWNFQAATVGAQTPYPYLADGGISTNIGIAPFQVNTPAILGNYFNFSASGGTIAPRATNWYDELEDVWAYWKVNLSTLGFQNLKLSSKQYSVAAGPKSFKIQYSLNGTSWTDVIGGAVTVANDWTTGVVNNLPLPIALNNQSVIYLRWQANETNTSNISTSAIDDIIITGESLPSGILLQSTATGTGSLIHSNEGVTATVERYLTGFSPYTSSVWHLISSPVSGQSIPSMVLASPFAQNGAMYGLAPYDNNAVPIPNWVPYTTTSLAGAGTFIPAKGYEAMLTANFALNFKGTLTTANTTAAVQVGANDWNLIGNPFSASIFANAPADAVNNFLTTNLTMFPSEFPHGHSHTAVYMWNPATAQYMAVNNASPATYIQVGQSFFVKTAATGTASFTTAMRTHSSAPFYKNTQSIWPVIDLNAKIDDNSRNTQIYYIPGTTAGVDNGYDAGVFTGTGTANIIYTKIEGNDVDFAIQSLPDTDYENQVVPIGLNAQQGSAITFTAEAMNLPGNMKVFLEDRLKGLFIRLDEAGSAYTVVLTSASSGAGRFYLHTSPLFLGTENQLADMYTIIPLPAENRIRVSGKMASSSIAEIYSITGIKICTFALSAGTENIIPFENSTNGIYILKIQSGKNIINKKFNWVY